MRKIISLICLMLSTLACADQLNIRPDAPDRYVVVKGDTLWDISGKFFKDPWKWPYIWGLNKDTIKDPHWIYPEDVINLDRATGTLRIGPVVESPRRSAATIATPGTVEPSDTTIRLAPKVHESPSDYGAIPSIPANIIEPFLNRPLVVEEDELDGAPTLVGAREGRVILGDNDIAFAQGLSEDQGAKWQIYRPGKKFYDPDTGEMLGIETVYLGSAQVKEFAEVSTLSITSAVQEIRKGDLLVALSTNAGDPYLPRAPDEDISAQVISVFGGLTQAGQNTAIVLNKGARDGLEVGHVLALYKKGEKVKSGKTFIFWDKTYKLPDERYGLVFVFRVFNKVSYALVMQTKLPVQLLDRAQTP